MSNQLEKLLSNFKAAATGGRRAANGAEFKTYAITNFRGGIGKSTLAFNLAWEISRTKRELLIDVCPQCNFSQSLLGDDLALNESTIYEALLPRIQAGASTLDIDELLVSVPPSCSTFKAGKKVYTIPGSQELFLFPSLLYTQLNSVSNLAAKVQKEICRNILYSLKDVVETAAEHIKASKVLIDTSPFFGGATHLAWVAADALVIPVRVDQHSMEALKLTLSMLSDPDRDFLRLNEKAGITKTPKIHAIVMTHCGWNRQANFTPDRSTQSYLSQIIEIVNHHSDLFATDPIDSIHLLDDFHSAGRISGTKRIPLAKLTVGESHTINGQKLEVNDSLKRYQNELKALASTL